jgi:hypothetical protein
MSLENRKRDILCFLFRVNSIWKFFLKFVRNCENTIKKILHNTIAAEKAVY